MEFMVLRICLLFVIASQTIAACWSHQIESDRLIMRKPTEDDRAFFEQLLVQPSMAEAYGEKEITEQMASRIARGIMRWGQWSHNYTICLKEGMISIGTFQVCYIPQCSGPLKDIPEAYRDKVCQDMGVDFGYMIDEGHQKKGYATEALAAFKAYISANPVAYFHSEMYNDVFPKALYAMISRNNTASIRVVTKNGFKLFGDEVNKLDRQLYVWQFPEAKN